MNVLRPRLLALLASSIALLAAAPAAFAADGVLEISQACAAGPGCFPGDAPGFPVTISSLAGSHSFALTSDIAVPTNAETAIEISRTNVSIDLRGFEIACRNAIGVPCGGADDSTQFAGGDGIRVTSSSVAYVEVHGGSINSMGDDGVELGAHAWVHDLRTIGNGGVGIGTNDSSEIRDCQIHDNGSHGIYNRTSGRSRAIGNSVIANGGTGLQMILEGLLAVLSYYDENVILNNGGGVAAGAFSGGGNFCGAGGGC